MVKVKPARPAPETTVPLISVHRMPRPQSFVRPMKDRSRYLKRTGYDLKTREVCVKSTVHDIETLEVKRREVDAIRDHIAAEVELCAPVDILCKERFYDEIAPVWYNLLADFLHIYNPSEDASKCSERCLKKKTTICINQTAGVYGCWVHGYLHLCRKSRASCYVVHTNRDLSLTCVLSGENLGYMDSNGASYRGAEGNRKQHYDYYNELNRANAVRDTTHNEFDSDAALISRYVGGTDHRTFEKENCPVKSFGGDTPKPEMNQDGSVPEIYSRMVDSVNISVATEQLPPPPPPSANSTFSVLNEPPKIKFGRMVDIHADDAEQKRETLARTMTRFALLNSSSAVQGLANSAMRIASRLVRTVIMEVIEDIFRAENRILYNTYQRKLTSHKASEGARLLFKRARKESTLVCMPDLLLLLDSFNRDFIEIAAFVKRDPVYFERIAENITWLWQKCNLSPFVLRNLTRNASTGVDSASPNGDGMCSLRQFTLACLYHMREGLTVSVPYSFVGDTILVLSPHPAMIMDLPPEDHVCFFGDEAMTELRRCIDNALFDPRHFDLNRVSINATDTIRNGKRQRLTDSASTSDSRSLALSQSMSIESGLQMIKSARRRKSKAKSTLEEVTKMERSQSYSSGTVTVTSTACGNASTSITELQCTPFYMREPMLTGGSKTTRKNVYSENDIKQGRQFITMALNSYEHKIANLRN